MTIKSSEREWLLLSNPWFNGAGYSVRSLYEALDAAQKAADIVVTQGDIGSLTLPVRKDQLESHNEKREKLVSFCNGIHYELSELVDNPFSVKMSETAQQAYALNPSNATVQSGTSQFSLTQLISSTPMDEKLKADFDKRYAALDGDEPSTELKEAMKEAAFWDKEYERAETCQKISEEVFNDEVRKNWSTMTPEERKTIIETYLSRLSNDEALVGVKLDATFASATLYGQAKSADSIELNESFIYNPSAPYTIDKLIDTVTHEARHTYQIEAQANPEKFGIPENLVSDWDRANYVSYSQGDSDEQYEKYYVQPMEADARGFAALGRPE